MKLVIAPEKFDEYQLVIFNNWDMESVPPPRKQALEKFVQEGGGLLWIAGEHNVYVENKRPDDALERRASVLKALYQKSDISYGNYQEGIKVTDLHLRPGRIYSRIREPYFFSYVRDELIRRYGVATVRSGGLKVYTTIDPRMQRAATKAIKDTLYYDTDPASALVAIDPRTGAIKTMTAVTPGRTGNQFNLVAQARRQPGSTFKTVTALAALDAGPVSVYDAEGQPER